MEIPEKVNPAKVLMPLNGRVLFVKDEGESKTKSGILLPDSAKVEVLTGRIIAISKDVRDNPAYDDLKTYDKVIVNYVGAVPVELTPDNKKFFLPVTSIIGVWKNPDDVELEE